MNSTLSSTSVDTQLHPPQRHVQVAPAIRRVGFADRIALHVGLALVMWSRRPQSPAPTLGPSRAEVLDRLRREDHGKRMYHLNQPWR